MSSNTRQKVLVGFIVVLALIAIAEIALLIKLKVEHEKMYIPLLHKMGLVHNDQQNKALDSNIINFIKVDDKNFSTAIPEKNTVQNPIVASQNNSTVQNTNSNLTDADKQYIQSLITSNLAPVNNKLNQNAVAIAAANNNATQALAAINSVQQNINDRLAKNETAISVANNNSTQALSAVNAIQKNINDRLTKDESAIAAANENANKTFATLSSTIASTNDRLEKDETAISQANDNANKLLATMSDNNKVSGLVGQENSTAQTGGASNNATSVKSSPVLATSAVKQVINQQSSASTPVNAGITGKSMDTQTSNSTATSSPHVQILNSKSTTIVGQTHKHHHIMQLPGVYARVMRANPASYTVQLIADSGLQSLYEYMWAFCLGYSATPLHTKHLGQNWYVLIYGQFNSVYQANLALAQFPYNALRWRPFVRRMSDVQRMITDARGEDALGGQK